MRGKKAKRLRDEIYEDRATNRASRSYQIDEVGTVVSDQWRRKYQRAKKGK